MSPIDRRPPSRDLEALRLIGLGRIPLCGRCARYRALLQARRAPGTPGALPEVPDFCTYQVCAPLAARHESNRTWPRRLAGLGGG